MTEQGPEWSEIAGQVTTSEAPHVIRSEQRAQQKLHDVTRLVSDWIWETDPDFRLTYVSPRVMESLGFHPLELLGCSLADLGDFTVAGSGPPAWRSPFREIPFEALDRSGKKRLLMLGGLPIFDPADGSFEGVRGSARDVTESRQAEHRLIAAKREAEFANLSKSEFLANMSHELRTPLNAVIGFAEMMIGEIFGPHGSPKYNEYVTDIKLSADHLLKIIDDILDISKIETGHLDVEMQVLAVDEIIASCLSLIRHRARQSDVRLISEVQPGLTLFADPRLLQQILLNLLTNAVKFTPRGGSVTISAGQGPDGAPRIAVSDTGIGIAAADIDRVLEPFVRLESAFCANVEGTGLGLPLVKSLVELHGGSLEIESRPDTGTTVSVLFPDPGIIHDSGLDLCSSNGQREQRHGERAF